MRNASADIAAVENVALVPFGAGNERSFWTALVEGKRLPHLGFTRADASPLRNALAPGDVVFRGGPGAMERFPFIDEKTREFLASGRLKRIYFDVTNMDILSGTVGEGRFAFVELKLIAENDDFFLVTSFYKAGKFVRASRETMRTMVFQLLDGKV